MEKFDESAYMFIVSVRIWLNRISNGNHDVLSSSSCQWHWIQNSHITCDGASYVVRGRIIKKIQKDIFNNLAQQPYECVPRISRRTKVNYNETAYTRVCMMFYILIHQRGISAILCAEKKKLSAWKIFTAQPFLCKDFFFLLRQVQRKKKPNNTKKVYIFISQNMHVCGWKKSFFSRFICVYSFQNITYAPQLYTRSSSAYTMTTTVKTCTV